ncbi:MAG: hypothetical protein M4579_001595 [Chaenotheca gracillima]|nr:MAG: hypothetical protein M4579_001595 [Chaenotheca gracillima]
MAAHTLHGGALCRKCARSAFAKQLSVPSRAFATSPRTQKHGNVNSFTPASNPQLDALLQEFRSQIFIPAHLSKVHRELIHKPSKHPILKGDEPFMVDVGDEKVQLKPLDPMKDEPSTRKGIAEILRLMKEPQDWDNLPLFLEELRIARRKSLPSIRKEQLARKACEGGRDDILMQCLRKTSTIDLAMKEVEFVCEVMWGLRVKPVQARWDDLTTEKALKNAEQVLELLEHREHSGDLPLRRKSGDPRLSPEVIGVVFELAAVRATRHQGGEDTDGKVATYARRLKDALNNTNRLASGNANTKLMSLVPMWHGYMLASKVLQSRDEKDWALGQLNELQGEVEDILRSSKETDAKHDTRRGVLAWEQVQDPSTDS